MKPRVTSGSSGLMDITDASSLLMRLQMEGLQPGKGFYASVNVKCLFQGSASQLLRMWTSCRYLSRKGLLLT